jgi:hypothetical protein
VLSGGYAGRMDGITVQVRYSAEFDPVACRIWNEQIAFAPPVAMQVSDGEPTTLRAGSVITVTDPA